MKLRTLIVTVLVLAALSAAAFFARRGGPPPSRDARLNHALVDPAVVEKAAQLRLTDQGKTITLTRQADGTWRVPSYYDLPADFSKLSSFIASLTDAKVERFVTDRADRIARLEFKDTKIDLLDGAGKELWSVTLGKTSETGGGRFIRFGTEEKAYQATLNAWLDPEAKNWANAELLNVKPDDVAKIEIPFGEGGPVTVSRAKKDDPWTADRTPAGQKVKADKIAAVLGAVGNIRFSDTNNLDDPNFTAAQANERVFKLTTFDHKTIAVALGRKPEEKKLKSPTATTDGQSGPGALGTVADLARKEADEKASPPAENSDAKTENKDADAAKAAKPLAPEYDTIPAGPVFVRIMPGDSAAPINALMQKRAYQISDYTFTGLPQKADELFEPAPPPAPASAPAPASEKPAAKQP